MKATIAEISQRFLNTFPNSKSAALRSVQTQTSDGFSISKSPITTILVHGLYDGKEAPLAVILITSPSQSFDDSSVLEFAIRRARAQKAPYFVTWTLRNAAIWRTPKLGAPSSRDFVEKLKDYAEIYEIGGGDHLTFTEPIKLKILERGRDILYDLEKLLRDEALELVQIDATYFVGRLLDAVQHLLPAVTESLHHRLQTEGGFRKEISEWAVKHTIAGATSDPEFAKSIGRQIIYRLLGKVLFYQSLRRSARQLPKLDLAGVDSSQVLPTLRTAFAKALEIDYHAVFEEDFADRLKWPSDASNELSSLVNDLNTRDFAHLPQDVVGTVFERLIPPEERHGLGQYFTGENLCDLIAAFCIRSPNDLVLDPTCGTGTFLIRAYDRLRWLGKHNHAALLSQIWGVDVAPFPAELATINLFRQRIAEHGNFPRIICKDFFEISPGTLFPFPPPKMDLEHPATIEEPIPCFDAIIGNFPYVSADQIDKHDADYFELLRKSLVEGWFDSYPQLFFFKGRKQQGAFQRHIAAGRHGGFTRDDVQHLISGFADLYVHLFFHTTRFLNVGGRMGIVTSNAWLDVSYGRELQEFLLHHFKIVAVLESRAEPWFVEASVNTVVTILELCDSPEQCDTNLARFVKVKRPLADLFPGDPVIEAPVRWRCLTTLVENIERAGIKYSKTYPLNLITEENDDFRIRVLRQGEMLERIGQSQGPSKWGKYLRAPDTFFELTQKASDKLCELNHLADMKRGSLTGINEFYHVSPETISRFNIEEEYLSPLIKVADDTSHRILVDPESLGKKVFVCRRTKDELKKLRHIGALAYIKWGEEQRFTTGKLAGMTWPHGIEVKNRPVAWYALPGYRGYSARVFWLKAYHDTYLQRFSPIDLIPDQRLYFLEPHKGIQPDVLAAILNSSLVALCLESIAPVAAGEGVCEVRLEDARDCLLVPDLRAISAVDRKNILKAFKPLLSRPIDKISVEIKHSDRQEFDSAVLMGIGLDPKKYLKSIYEGLSEMVTERIELGQMRGKARKTRARGDRAEKKIVEEVLDEILPQGPDRFPDEFFSTAAAGEPKIAFELPDLPLVFENTPLFKGVHVEGGSFNHDVKTPAEGKFLVYAQRAGHKVAALPEKTVEVTRTVANYEKYLRELRTDLYEAYYRRTLDTKTAARLTQAAFDRFRLPNIET
jgi:type I restriction enzyme M protein